jgi:hypothetical protein
VVDIPNSVATNSLQAGEFRRGYIETFNFTIQRELGSAFVLTTGYSGSRSIRQAVTYFEGNAGLVPGAGVNGRPLYQQFGVTTNRAFFIPMAHQRYESLQTNVSRRYSQGLYMTASYTWSKTIGFNQGNSDNGLRFYVPSQFSKNRAVTDFDRGHVLQTAWTYELPFGQGKKMLTEGVGAKIVGGWQINSAIALFSGTPFTVTAADASLNAPQNTQVADQVNETVTKMGGVGPGARFYDPTAFRPVTEVRFGNTSPNLLRGPRAFNLNTSLFRQFNMTERVNLQFRAEALNLTNTPFLNNPAANVSNADFMQITGTSTVSGTPPQRQFRFGLRVGF